MHAMAGMIPSQRLLGLDTVHDFHLPEIVFRPVTKVFAKRRVRWFLGVHADCANDSAADLA